MSGPSTLESINQSKQVEFRLKPERWALAAVPIGQGLNCLSLLVIIFWRSPYFWREWEDLALFLGLGSITGLFFAAAWWCISHQLRRCIVVDGEGLAWRGIGDWKRVCWDEVQDFTTNRRMSAQADTFF